MVATGYFCGDDVTDATETRTIGGVHAELNLATGTTNRKKHTWVVRRDGLIFGSGWHEE